MYYASNYWTHEELLSGIIQTEEYLMKGQITTDFHELTDDIFTFKSFYFSFLIPGSRTIH